MHDGEKKLVYVPMVADYLHPGHLNILRHAVELGEVMVGLYTDKAVASYKRLPFMNWEQRKEVVESIKGVKYVVPQNEKEYEPNLRKYKPHYMVHGTDWREGPLAKARENAINVMAEWGGEVVEPEYTSGVSSSDFHDKAKNFGVMPQARLSILRRLLDVKPIIRIIESHSAMCAIVAEHAKADIPGEEVRRFDGLWLSSLTDSSVRGKPDTEFVDLTSRVVTVNDILEVSTKPIIYDGDTGSLPEHFAFTVKRLERLGVSAVIIEDKTGAKRNSLLEFTENLHLQEDISAFAYKIRTGKQAQLTNEFMIIARLESLILGKGVEHALERAHAFIEAGADGVMIHSRIAGGKEVFEFCKEYSKFENRRPLVAVPTNYSTVYENELRDAGVNIVIYANQMLRSSFTGMLKAAETILQNGRAYEADHKYISALNLIKLIEGNG
jgi:phosphoenolpyruvate phosphomutase